VMYMMKAHTATTTKAGSTTSRTNPPLFILGRHITTASSPVACQTLQTFLCMSVCSPTKNSTKHTKMAARASFPRIIKHRTSPFAWDFVRAGIVRKMNQTPALSRCPIRTLSGRGTDGFS
jgi:hypothetical protein